MKAVHELKERLCDELENIGKSGKLDMPTLEKVDKIAGAAYHLEKLIKASDGEEYSERGGSYRGDSYRGGGSYRGGSYRDSYDDGGYSERRRDSMGRYARDGGSYSMHDDISEKLRRMAETGSDQERQFARKMLQEM